LSDRAASSPISVFIAGTTEEWLPARVLEFSIRETTAWPVEARLIESFGRSIPKPTHRRNQARTPFSFQRFLIPELCQFQGRAIYLDADMQVFSDLAPLWTMPMGTHDLLTVDEGGRGKNGQFSVMLLDCERLTWRVEDIVQGLDRGDYSYEQLLHEMCVAREIGRHIPAGWNSLEHHDPLTTHLLHYTNMTTQPWVATSNPLAHLWVACLRRALQKEFITFAEVEREVRAGHVRPSLMAQIDEATSDPLTVPEAGQRRLDHGFVAPYRRLAGERWRGWAFFKRHLLGRH